VRPTKFLFILARKELKEIQAELMELQQDVTECKTDIADNKQNISDNKQNISDNKQEIHNIDTRHIPPNIKSKLINCYIFFHIFFNGKASLKQECQCPSI
jgi:GTP-sensing pleiotropic transcriptional regulator CodY